MNTTNATEFRNNMKKTLDSVSNDKEIIIVHRANIEDVVLLPISEYNSLIETNYLLSSEMNRNHLERGIRELKEGKTTSINIDEL